MAATINTNVQSLNAQRNLGVSQNSLATSMQRLSSGLRINSAKDHAAGLAISEPMSTQIRGQCHQQPAAHARTLRAIGQRHQQQFRPRRLAAGSLAARFGNRPRRYPDGI